MYLWALLYQYKYLFKQPSLACSILPFSDANILVASGLENSTWRCRIVKNEEGIDCPSEVLRNWVVWLHEPAVGYAHNFINLDAEERFFRSGENLLMNWKALSTILPLSLTRLEKMTWAWHVMSSELAGGVRRRMLNGWCLGRGSSCLYHPPWGCHHFRPSLVEVHLWWWTSTNSNSGTVYLQFVNSGHV